MDTARVVIFDYNGTLTENDASEWKPVLKSLQDDGYVICVASASAMPDTRWNEENELGEKDFDFILENVKAKGRADELVPAVQQAYQLFQENKKDMDMPVSVPEKEHMLIVDDAKITTLLLGNAGLGTVLFDKSMSPKDVHQRITTHFDRPESP